MKNLFVKTFILSSFLFAFSIHASEDHAEHNHEGHDHSEHDHGEHKDHAKSKSADKADDFGLSEIKGSKSSKVVTKVHGMVCSFCATGVKKGFGKIDSVKSVEVNMDEMLVSLELKEGKEIDIAKIKSTVEESGYEFRGARYE